MSIYQLKYNNRFTGPLKLFVRKRINTVRYVAYLLACKHAGVESMSEQEAAIAMFNIGTKWLTDRTSFATMETINLLAKDLKMRHYERELLSKAILYGGIYDIIIMGERHKLTTFGAFVDAIIKPVMDVKVLPHQLFDVEAQRARHLVITNMVPALGDPNAVLTIANYRTQANRKLIVCPYNLTNMIEQ